MGMANEDHPKTKKEKYFRFELTKSNVSRSSEL